MSFAPPDIYGLAAVPAIQQNASDRDVESSGAFTVNFPRRLRSDVGSYRYDGRFPAQTL